MFFDPDQKYDQPEIANAFNGWVDIQAPIGKVFRFLTEEDKLSQWWADHCTAEPKPGGRLHYVWDGEKALTGDAVFRQFEPPFRVVIEWTRRNGEPIPRSGDDPRGMRWLPLNIYELAGIEGEATRVHLHDVGLAAGPEYAELRRATEQGWREALARLKKTVERAHWRETKAQIQREAARRAKIAADSDEEA